MVKRLLKDNSKLTYLKLRRQKGFMLSEILVVLAIVSLLTTVVLINHRETQKKLALERAIHKVAQDIRVAQEMALSGRECPPAECGGTQPYGYGVYFTENSDEYILYADMNGNQFYEASDEPIETITLEGGVLLTKIVPLSTSKVSVNFEPPDPVIKIKWGMGAGQQNSTTELTLSLDSEDRTITVNTVGLIEID